MAPRHWAAALAGWLLLVGCQRDNNPTAPTATAETRAVSVDLRAAGGLNVVGPYANVAVPYVNNGFNAARRRWPMCLLNGWTVQLVGSLGAPPGTMCGSRPCATGTPIFGLTQPGPRRITLSLSMPGARAQSIVNWEVCNACRYVVTRQLIDRGCS